MRICWCQKRNLETVHLDFGVFFYYLKIKSGVFYCLPLNFEGGMAHTEAVHLLEAL